MTTPPLHFLTLSLTNVCQQRCRFCDYDHNLAHKREYARFLQLSTIKKMEWLGDVQQQICLCGNGEVLTHPEFPEIIKTVREIANKAKILVYTNGLSLCGKNLDATMRYADSLHISQNAISKKAYNAIIYNGNYERALKNLEAVALTNYRNIPVNLSFVLLRELGQDIIPALKIAAKYKFKTVSLLHPRKPTIQFDHLLDNSSFQLPPEFNLAKTQELARELGIVLQYSEPSNCKLYCNSPFDSLQIDITPAGLIELNCCCRGSTNIFINENNLPNFELLYNNERFNFIRKTVNDPEAVLANKMCLRCRCLHRNSTEAEKKQFFNKFRINLNNYNKPVFFEEINL